MSKFKSVTDEVKVQVQNYKIQSWVKKKGFVADYYRIKQPTIVINQEVYEDGRDPNTGQPAKIIKYPAQLFIDGKLVEPFEIPGDLDMRIIYSLGQAKVIEITKEQAIVYNEFAKKLHAGEIK